MQKSPVILGVATLDAQHLAGRVLTSFGGVGKNVACALGQLGGAPRFVSPEHGPELNAALREHFKLSKVSWNRLDLKVDMPFFKAYLGAQGEVKRERYYDNGAFKPLTPAFLQQSSAQLLAQTDVLVISTDLHQRSLKALSQICQQQQIPLFLISSSRLKAPRIRTIQPDILAMNFAELSMLFQLADHKPQTLAPLAAQLVQADGACLVTLGSGGALLVLPKQQQWLLQTVPLLKPASTVGAGDNLLAALIYYRQQALDWPQILIQATRHTLSYLGSATDELPELITGTFSYVDPKL